MKGPLQKLFICIPYSKAQNWVLSVEWIHELICKDPQQEGGEANRKGSHKVNMRTFKATSRRPHYPPAIIIHSLPCPGRLWLFPQVPCSQGDLPELVLLLPWSIFRTVWDSVTWKSTKMNRLGEASSSMHTHRINHKANQSLNTYIMVGNINGSSQVGWRVWGMKYNV